MFLAAAHALALALAAVTAPAAAAEPVVVERVLAVVDNVPVLLSEVRLVEALRGVERAAALEAVIDERLMLQEAARLTRAAVTHAEAEAAYQGLVATQPAAAALPEEGVRRLARRQTAILKYVEFRFRPQVRVSEDELRRAYDAAAAQGETRPFVEAAEALRERLARAQLDAKIEDWVHELRRAADVRVTPPLGGAAPPPAP